MSATTAGRPARGARTAPVTPLVQRGQCPLGRAGAVDDDRGHAGPGRGLERGVPPLVDLDQVDQRPDDAVDLAEELAAARSAHFGQGAFECLGSGCRAVLGVGGIVGRRLGRLRRRGRPRSSSRRARRPARPRSAAVACSSSRADALTSRSARDRGAAPRCSSVAHPGAQRSNVVLLARPRRGPPARRGPRPGPAPRRVRRRPGLPSPPVRPAPPAPRRAAASAGRRAQPARLRAATASVRLRRGQLAGQPGRLGLERGHHVDVGRGVERGDDRPPPLAAAGPRAPRARSTRPCTRPSALARSSSRRDESSAVVEAASASRLLERPRAARAPRRGTRPGSAPRSRRRAVRSASSAPAR